MPESKQLILSVMVERGHAIVSEVFGRLGTMFHILFARHHHRGTRLTSFTSWRKDGAMKRSTITLPHDLAAGLQAYAGRQEVEPTLTAVVQAALREYLGRRGMYSSPRILRITPARRRSGKRDVSVRHDEYLTQRE